MTKTHFEPVPSTNFMPELAQLVCGTGLTQQAFLDELNAQLDETFSLSRFNSWIRGRFSPSEELQDRILRAARSVATEAARYPRPPQDVPAEVAMDKLAEWQKQLTLKQISVITGLPFITLNSWRIGKHRKVRYAKWQQALRLMDLWLESSRDIRNTMQEAQTIIRHRPVRKGASSSDTEKTTSENRISGILSLSRTDAGPDVERV